MSTAHLNPISRFSPGRLLVNVNTRRLATAVGLLAFCLVFFAYVQYGSDALAGNDGYYHIKMGWLIRQEGLKPDFPWLPLTILNAAHFYDHHLLYHIYLALFATTDPAQDGGLALTQGAKLASIILPSLAFLAIWWLLQSQNVPWPSLWTIALFALSEGFLYRMSMARAQSASLLFLVLGLHWLLTKRYHWLLPLGFAYVWLYNAFPLLLLMAGVYFVATAVMEHRLAWPALIYPLVGIGLGIIVNPYFPENVTFILNHLLPKLGAPVTRVGNEWYPYETWTLVQNSGGALAAMVLATLALGWREQRLEKRTLVAFSLAVGFGLMLFKSRRFIEYFPAFALIFAAFAAAPLWHSTQASLRDAAGRIGNSAIQYILTYLLPVLFLLALAGPLFHNLGKARAEIAEAKAANHYAAAMAWLRENTAAGTVIFQTDWDDFTRLFFYHGDAIYTAGLDPTFMELYDADLFNTWRDITRGRVKEPAELIRQQFGGQYVFSDLEHTAFMKVAANDPRLQELYRDEYAVIYVVLD
jgi:hypothetical protein